MRTKPDYQLKLNELAPRVVFEVKWSHDEDARWPSEFGERGEFMPFNADVSARTIVDGEEIEGNAYLGGCWEIPSKIDPEIGGYLPQMLEEAALELQRQITQPSSLWLELGAAISFLKKVLQDRYDAHQKKGEECV